jgi:hypothetical protein
METPDWEVYLLSASWYAESDSVAAEKLYKRALRTATRECGGQSAAAGMVLVDFADFLERQGRDNEAHQLHEEIGRVLRGYVTNAHQQIICMLENCYQLSSYFMQDPERYL